MAEYKLSYTASEINEKLSKIGDSSAIIDVTELPTENINEQAFYRLLVGTFYDYGVPDPYVTCYIVDSLPEEGIPFWREESDFYVVYYSTTTNAASVYIDSNISSEEDLPVGWLAIEDYFAHWDDPWYGVISDTSTVPNNGYCLVLGYQLYQYKQNWINISDKIGWRGAGQGAEVFNTQGNIAAGDCSHAEGYETCAIGDCSHAEGCITNAIGDYSHAEGKGWQETRLLTGDIGSYIYIVDNIDFLFKGMTVIHTVSDGNESWTISAQIISIDYDSSTITLSESLSVDKALENESVTIYFGVVACGLASHAEGYETSAIGDFSHAEGEDTYAKGKESHAEGEGTVTEGLASHAEGGYTSAIGDYSHAEGSGSQVTRLLTGDINSDTYIINNIEYLSYYGTGAIVARTILDGDDSWVEYAQIIDYDLDNSTITLSESLSVDKALENESVLIYFGGVAIGEASHVEGYETHAVGNASHAEGYHSHAEGDYSHAEGDSTYAIGYASHTEGDSTYAIGYASHAEGRYTSAAGEISHAEGFFTHAEGHASHAEGYYTHAVGRSQHVQGEYNLTDPDYDEENSFERGRYAHIVGNGESNSERSNAHTLDWSGNAWFAGDVYVGSTSGTDKDEGSVKLQKAITGAPGQIVGFDSNGNAVAQEAPSGGGTTIIMSETSPSDITEGGYWYMIMTSLEAPKEMIKYTITLPTGVGYVVNPTNANDVVYGGDNYSFTVTISNGYQAGANFSVKANGVTLTASGGVYTIVDITANQTITVDGVEKAPATVTITGTGNSTYCYATINGTKYSSAASNIKVNEGDIITFGVYGRSTTYYGNVVINNSEVFEVTNQTTQTYDWTVPAGVSTISISMSYTSSSTQRRGRITVTTA